MFTFHVDLGQLIIAGLIGVVGYFVKRTIDRFETKIEQHENIFFNMNTDIQRLIGYLGVERRKSFRRNNIHEP